MLHRAAEVLRAHGINAYEQGGEVVIYAVKSGVWHEVVRLSSKRCEPQQIANELAHRLADIVAGPHTHDLG